MVPLLLPCTHERRRLSPDARRESARRRGDLGDNPPGEAGLLELPLQRVRTLATARGTPMATSAGAGARPITICPACGYPRLGAGLCAACIQTSPSVPVDPEMNTVAGVSHFDPAA